MSSITVSYIIIDLSLQIQLNNIIIMLFPNDRDIIRLSDYVGMAGLTQASRTEYILKASKLLHVSHCTTGALF